MWKTTHIIFSKFVNNFNNKEQMITEEIEQEINFDGNRLKLEYFESYDGSGGGPSVWNHSCMICCLFDVTDVESFENCKNWIFCGDRYITNEHVKIIVGTKIDRERVVTREQGEEMAKELDSEYFEISSKTGEGIPELVEAINDKICEIFLAQTRTSPPKEKCLIC